MGDKYMFHSFISLQQFDKSHTDGMNVFIDKIIIFRTSHLNVATGPNRVFINKLTLLSHNTFPPCSALACENGNDKISLFRQNHRKTQS